MASPGVHRLRVALLCVDRETRKFVLLEPGSTVTYVSGEDPGMVNLRHCGRDVLAFAVDFANRADAVWESYTEIPLRS
jgi:hypothetical protein